MCLQTGTAFCHNHLQACPGFGCLHRIWEKSRHLMDPPMTIAKVISRDLFCNLRVAWILSGGLHTSAASWLQRFFFLFSSQSTRVGCFIRHSMGVSSSDNGTWRGAELSSSSFARFYQEKKSRDSNKTHFVALNEEPSLRPAVIVVGYSRTWVLNCVFPRQW